MVETRFRMETVQSVLSSLRQYDWTVSLDLKDAYLQVPVHPESRHFLRFITSEGIFQFRVLCFGRTASPQVFTRVMAPVSVILHSRGVRMFRYLDDWLVQASSRKECLSARDKVSELCQDLGSVITCEGPPDSPQEILGFPGRGLPRPGTPGIVVRTSVGGWSLVVWNWAAKVINCSINS